MAEKEYLVGSDGKLVTVALGTELVGDGISDLDDLVGGGTGSGEGWYVITALAAASALPAGLAVNDLFWDDGTLVPATDDKVKFMTETEQSDVTSFKITIDRSEIDVTPLGFDYKVYRGGKRDMSGSLEGITTIGKTDAAGWVLNNFIKTIEQAAAGTVIVREVDESAIYLKGIIQKDASSGEKEAFIWCKILLLGTELGAAGEDAQSWSSNFRIAPDADVTPTLYIREIA